MKKFWDCVWRFGANFTPSTAVNQLEMWQAETFDPATIDRELGYAQGVGMNIMRVFLHDLLWEQDAPGFLSRMERYLEIAESHGIATMFVFFDDCWKPDFALGKQPDPIPYTHNSGWIQSPGNRVADDLTQRPRLETYVKGVLQHFAHDRHIAAWDLYNEPVNSMFGEMRGDKSLPLLRDVFRWAKEVSIDQPVTAGVFALYPQLQNLNNFMLQESEILTFHSYCAPQVFARDCEFYRTLADGRPVICTEYMARPVENNFGNCLPILRKNHIGAIHWGLVAGKTQTIYSYVNQGKPIDFPDPPFHDVFHADGSFLVPAEKEVFQKVLGEK